MESQIIIGIQIKMLHPQWFYYIGRYIKNVLAGLLNNSLLAPDEYNSILEVLKTM